MGLPDYHFFVNLGRSFSCFPEQLAQKGKLNGHWETGDLVSHFCWSHYANLSYTGHRHGFGMDTQPSQEGKEGFKRQKFERIPQGFLAPIAWRTKNIIYPTRYNSIGYPEREKENRDETKK